MFVKHLYYYFDKHMIISSDFLNRDINFNRNIPLAHIAFTQNPDNLVHQGVPRVFYRESTFDFSTEFSRITEAFQHTVAYLQNQHPQLTFSQLSHLRTNLHAWNRKIDTHNERIEQHPLLSIANSVVEWLSCGSLSWRIDRLNLVGIDEMVEQRAAIKMQALSRGGLARFRAHRLQEAVTKMQSIYRGTLVRRSLPALREARDALITLQTAIRTHLEEQRLQQLQRSLLPLSIVQKTIAHMNKPEASLKRAVGGKSPVYLGPDFVMKYSGKDARERFRKTLDAGTVCERAGYKFLTVPKVGILQDRGSGIVIEGLLPIKQFTFTEQLFLYIEQGPLFTNVIREFADFCCSNFLEDLIGGNNHPLQDFINEPCGRYPNVPLYIEEGQGKMGLVDLETFEEGYHSNFIELVRLFPYHLEDILAIGKQNGWRMENIEQELREVQQKMLPLCELFKIISNI